jgi:hypothetical protein
LRYTLLEELVDPLNGAGLRVENADTVPRPGPATLRCTRLCGRLGRPVAEVNVQEHNVCHDNWIVTGELVRGR